MIRPAVAIFVKTPGYSPVKTRLAAVVGEARAEQFYRLCVEAVEAVLRSCGASGPKPYWAVSEAAAIDGPIWRRFERIGQGEGGLGERLNRVYRDLRDRHGTVLFVGADGPLLSKELIEAAVEPLGKENRSFALSRSADGGYGLFAGRRALPADVWTTVPYSCERTADEFVGRLRAHGDVVELPPLDDVDAFDDLSRLIELAAGRALLPEQAAVIAYARQLIEAPGRG